jgi:Protein of unknown function (DUF4054)
MATSQDVIAFRLNYPEFKTLNDGDVAGALDDADVWVDGRLWSPRDYQTGRYLWAAHNLNILIVLQGNLEAMGDKLGFANQTLATVGFGERRVAFRQLRLLQTGQNVYATGPDQSLAETTYGQQFLMIRSRNIMPILTV